MSAKLKIVLLALAFIVPYMAAMVPTLLKYQNGQVPAWIPLAGGFYLLFTVVSLTLISQRMGSQQRSGALPQNAQLTARFNNAGKLLIAFWSLFFLYGAGKALRGDIPLNRAVPAGILLLSFISVFSWFAYRSSKGKIG